MGSSIRKFTEMPLQNAPTLGARVICDIPLTADLERVGILLSGIVTIGVAASTGLVSDGIPNIIEDISLIGDGRDTIAQISMAQLVSGNMFRRKGGSVSSVQQPALAVGAQAFEVEAILDLAQYGAIVPKESSVRENNYKTLQLAVRFNAAWTSVLVAGAGTTFATAALNLVVTADECLELPDGAGVVSTPILKPLISGRDELFSAAANRIRFRLTPDQGLRGISLRMLNVTGNLSDSVLGRARVYVGKDLRVDLSANSIAELSKINMNGVRPQGYYYIDFADRAGAPDLMNDCLDLRRAITQGADAYLELDTLVAGSVNVVQWGLTGV